MLRKNILKIAPLFNEFTLTSVVLDESEALNFYNLDEIDKSTNTKPYYLLEQLALVVVESETRPTVNAHKFIHYELKFDLNNHYTPIREKIVCMLNERDDAIYNERIEEVDNYANW